MATKAEEARYEEERSGPKKEKPIPHQRRRSAPASKGPGETFLNRRDRSKKAARKVHERPRGSLGL